METARPQEAGCLHLLWLLRGEGEPERTGRCKAQHGTPHGNGSALDIRHYRAVDDTLSCRTARALPSAPARG